ALTCATTIPPLRPYTTLFRSENNGLIVNTEVFEANGTAERDAALVMLEQIPGTKQVTVGGDKAYDRSDFVAECRNLKVTPHVAQDRKSTRLNSSHQIISYAVF